MGTTIFRKLFPALVLAAPATLAGCSNEPENDGSIRGTLAVSVATMRDGTSQTMYRLVLDESERNERRLLFAEEPELAPGSEIKVWGELDGNDIVVRRFDVLDDDARSGTGRSHEPLIDAPPHPNRTVGVVLVGSDGTEIDYPPSRATTDYFGLASTDHSLKQWFGEASYGVQDITGAVARIAEPFYDCGTTPDTEQFESQANTALGMTPDHYVWILLESVNCTYDGLGYNGTASNPASHSWIYGPFNMDGGAGCALRAHGPLFNMGHMASTSLDCGDEIFLNDPTQLCAERIDTEDVMGTVNCRHLAAMGKQYGGWYGGCNSVRVNQSGVYTLFPAEIECNGIQVLQVPMPTVGLPTGGRVLTTINGPRPVEFYYLELRTNTGFDGGTGRTPKVIVRIGSDYGPSNRIARSTWMLDMNPATVITGDGMTAGQTFTDPAGGVAFTVQALSNTSATVSVTVPTNSANACAGGGTIAAPGPSTCGSAGAGGMGGAGGMAGVGGASGGLGGIGGAAGSGGAAGTGGRGGAGAGGTAGGAGTSNGGAGGGSAGAAGAGTGGAGGEDAGGAGAGGDAGEGGASTGGSAGDAGSSGTDGASGSGGASPGGAGRGGTSTGGTTSSGGSNRGGIDDDSDDGAGDDSGCGCRIDKSPPRGDAALALGLLAVLAGVRRRRRR